MASRPIDLDGTIRAEYVFEKSLLFTPTMASLVIDAGVIKKVVEKHLFPSQIRINALLLFSFYSSLLFHYIPLVRVLVLAYAILSSLSSSVVLLVKIFRSLCLSSNAVPLSSVSTSLRR